MSETPTPPNPAGEHPPETASNSPALTAKAGTVIKIAAGIAVFFTIFLVIGIVERFDTSQQLNADALAKAAAVPKVFVVHPVAAKTLDWSLPATTESYQDAIIYARIAGYLTKRYVDIGDHVKMGQLLAEIQAPESDQQLSQARADLQQSSKQLDEQKTDLDLAQTTMSRYVALNQTGAVSKEVVDKAVAAYNAAKSSLLAAQANVNSNQANVQRYEALTAFERVLAPFDGIVTQRNVDVGALISVGSPINNTGAAPTTLTGTATGMFEISQIDTIRVFVSVPQVIAPNVKPGVKATVTIRGKLTAPVEATVTRTADSLDPGTRTLLTELDIPNSSHAILPGEFVDVVFSLSPSGMRWNLPATTLIFNGVGTQVMAVDSQNKLHLQNVVVGRDYGDTIDIQEGLEGNETIVAQPDVSLNDGQVVTPVELQSSP